MQCPRIEESIDYERRNDMGYCTKCGFQMEEGAKFCSQCGTPKVNSSEEITIKLSNVIYCSINRKKVGTLFGAIISILIIAIIVTIVRYSGTGYICDGCNEKKYGTSYYDVLKDDMYYCKDCAKKYYAGLDYTGFARER